MKFLCSVCKLDFDGDIAETVFTSMKKEEESGEIKSVYVFCCPLCCPDDE